MSRASHAGTGVASDAQSAINFSVPDKETVLVAVLEGRGGRYKHARCLNFKIGGRIPRRRVIPRLGASYPTLLAMASAERAKRARGCDGVTARGH